MTRILTSAAAAAFLVASTASASLVAGWDFSNLTGGIGNFGPNTLAAASSDANVTVNGLTRGNGVTTPASTNAASHAWGGAGWMSTNESQAAQNGDYVSFGFTAGEGYLLSLNAINAYNVRHSSSGPIYGRWQYQVGGGEFVNIGSTITWGSVTNSAGNPQAGIELGGIESLQNLAAGTTVTFRLLNWSASGANGTWYLNDPGSQSGGPLDFVVEGTVTATPAPGAIALLGAVGLVANRRRRHGF